MKTEKNMSEPSTFFLDDEGGRIPRGIRNEIIHIVIGPRVKEIRSAHDFGLSTALRSVAIPATVTKIGMSAFSCCESLVTVELNEGLESIGEQAFVYCRALRSVNIPSTVTKIGMFAFSSCESLATVELNEGLEVVGEKAFQFCRALRSVKTPSTVTEIGPETFYDCKALRSVTIPATVTKVGMSAFLGCESLVTVELNEGLESIGEQAFEYCRALRSVNIPSTVTKIGVSAFSSCESLATVELNEGLEVVGEKAFQFCRALRSVTISASVMELGEGAFCSCHNLSEVIFLGGERLLNRGILDRGLVIEGEEGFLNEGALNELTSRDNECYAFYHCLHLATVKISTSWALSERMAGLPKVCRTSFQTAIRDMRGLELTPDGTVLACFPVSGSEHTGARNVRDTNMETARSFLRVWIALHDLKESIVLIQLAMLKNWQVTVPEPAMSVILEHCGFTGFLS